MVWLVRLLLLLLLIVLLLRAVWRLFGGIAEGAAGSAPRVPRKGTQMVRDPVCGTFVVQARALSASAGGETAWFCSDTCRRQWQAVRG
jgi:YHS domain-containing protein